jgi:VWFA-related protein
MKLRGGFRSHSILILGVCALAGVGAAFPQQSQAQSTAGQEKTSPAQAAQEPDATAAPQNGETPGLTVASDNEEPTAVIHATTRRVVVDMVVTGPDGKPVPSLTEQDFRVFENGKPQSVRAFEVHSPELDRSPLPPAPSELPSDTFVNLEQTPASGPPVVLLLDYLNTPVTDQAYAHEQIVRFLEKKPPSTEVAIFVLTDNLSLLQGYTTDTGKLLAAMRSKAAGLQMPANSERVQKAQITLDAFFDIGKFLAAVDGRKELLWFSESFDMMVLPNERDVEQGTLVIDDAQGSPNSGPVATVTASNMMPSSPAAGVTAGSASGFSNQMGDLRSLQEEMRKVAIALAVTQTAVYPIDVRGLATDPGESAAAPGASALTANPQGRSGTPGMPTAPGSAPAAAQQHTSFLQSMNAAQATMAQIADATGGHAFVNTNGLATAAEQAVSDGTTYYTLVYAPSNLNFDGGLRAIHVALDKPGCKLSYRSAYYAVDSGAVTPDAIQNDSLAAALVHGAPQAQGLIFKAQIDRDGAPAMAPPDSPLAVRAAINGRESKGRREKNEPHPLSGMVQAYDIRLSILAQQLQLTEMPDGRHHAALEVAVYAYAADGRKLGGTRQNLELSMPPAIYEQTLQDGMFHKLHVQLPVEAASLRLAILDPGNHRTASLEVPLPLPPSAQADVAAPSEAGPAAK